MKRCPECRRDYYDDSLHYCLDDGTALLEGPASGDSDTAVLSRTNIPAEENTRLQSASTEDTYIRTTSSAEYLISQVNRHKKGFLAAFFVVVVILSGLVYLYRTSSKVEKSSSSASTSPSVNIRALIATGNIRNVAISRDGKFLAFVKMENGQESIWTKQISTNSDIQVVSPSADMIYPLEINPSGDFVYFGRNSDRTVYRIPVLGGIPPTRVIIGCDGDLSFSRDGKQVLFERSTAADQQDLVTADADGSNERTIKSFKGDEYLVTEAFSPKGNEIAIVVDNLKSNPQQSIMILPVEGGDPREFTNQKWDLIRNIAWLDDANGIVFVGSNKGANVSSQIFEISYPNGDIRQITRDLNDYEHIELTNDSKELITLQKQFSSSIWVSPNTDISKAQQISKGKDEGGLGINWTGDGRIVYGSAASGASEIWISNKDGSNARQLTFDSVSKYTPAATSDNRYVFYIAEHDGTHLWRINVDGSQPVQITHGEFEANPRTSPDGKWVVYDSLQNGRSNLWRIPVEGGEPQRLTEFPAMEADISPDGKYIAYFYHQDRAGADWKIGVIPFDGGSQLKTFDILQNPFIDMSVGWTPDSKGITFVEKIGDNSNLWLQPFDGGPAKKLTDYKQGMFMRREWSRDGKQVAIVKGAETSDVVMITDFR